MVANALNIIYSLTCTKKQCICNFRLCGLYLPFPYLHIPSLRSVQVYVFRTYVFHPRHLYMPFSILVFCTPGTSDFRTCIFSAPEMTHLKWQKYFARIEQELSYYKQIVHHLCTQYVEGIHRHKYYTVTLKFRLRVTQDHWKWNHWTGHTRLTTSRVI